MLGNNVGLLRVRGRLAALGVIAILSSATLGAIWILTQGGEAQELGLGVPAENPCPPIGAPITSAFLDEHGLDRPLVPRDFVETARIVARTCYGSNDRLTGLDLHVTAPGEDALKVWSVIMIGEVDADPASMPPDRLSRQEERLSDLIGKPPFVRREAGTVSWVGIDPRSQLADLAWELDATAPVTELRWDPEWERIP